MSLLVSTGQQSTLQTLLPDIQTQLASLPPSQTTIYARINLAQRLMKLGTQQPALLLATKQKPGNFYETGFLGQW